LDEIKNKFEKKINQYLKGKRIIADAARGYKQYKKSYEFDVNNITIEDRYGNWVVIAHDMTVSKPKDYYLNTGRKIKIIGQATGQPSPQKGINPAQIKKQEEPPNDNIHNSSPSGNTTNINKPQITNIKEDEKNSVNITKNYESYSIDNIIEDVGSWLPLLLKKQDTPLADIVKKIGWTDHKEHGIVISVFKLKLPFSVLKYDNMTSKELQNLFYNKAPTLKLIKLEQNKKEQYWDLQIKKIYREK
jgi:hypothetical protein